MLLRRSEGQSGTGDLPRPSARRILIRKVSRLWGKPQKTRIEKVLQTLRPSQLYRGKPEAQEREGTAPRSQRKSMSGLKRMSTVHCSTKREQQQTLEGIWFLMVAKVPC